MTPRNAKRRHRPEEHPERRFITMDGKDWDLVRALMAELDRSTSEVVAYAVRAFHAVHLQQTRNSEVA